MKTSLSAALCLTLAAALILPGVADAKRVGGGKNAGMQRSAPTQQAPNTPPAQQASPQQAAPQQPAPQPAMAPAAAGATAATAAAAPAKRSWLGPIAGLAAGLGLAALMSHLGMGEAFANFLMVALLVVAAIFVVRLLMRRFGSGTAVRSEPALAGASTGSAASASAEAWNAPAAATSAEPTMARSSLAGAASSDVSVTGQPLRPLGASPLPAAEVAAATMPAAATPAAAGPTLPEGFDVPAFERVAKMIFIRLQAANDKADLDDLRQFTTPELFASLRLDLQERGSSTQTTDVEQVEARIVDFAAEEDRQVASVRFHGRIREEAGAPAEAFDEIWHLVKPETGGSWAIAGIQQAH